MNDERPRWKSIAAVLSFMLCIVSWELTAMLLLGGWQLGANWMNRTQQLAALSLSLALSIVHQFWGRRQLAGENLRHAGTRNQLTWPQAATVVFVMVSAGAFATWLFTHPR